ncbi:MAG: hypothetical protein Q4C01_05140 [Clostridia bacterium]|nr:hypothetical protein [Clostridia bacterium]
MTVQPVKDYKTEYPKMDESSLKEAEFDRNKYPEPERPARMGSIMIPESAPKRWFRRKMNKIRFFLKKRNRK